MSFVGGYADLTGFLVGNFKVECLAGRDRNRQPLWKTTCIFVRCGMEQTFTHRELSSALESGRPGEVLFCKNERCPNSRMKDVDETPSLFEMRRQEREKRQRAEQQAAADRASVEQEVAAAKAKEARLGPLRAEWNEYSNHQINAGVPLQEIAPLSRWAEISNSLRGRIMDAIRKDPVAKVTGLRR
jgi:hypothetical protein